MDSPAVPPPWAWGPGLIGTTIGFAFSGISIGQLTFYVQSFPQDQAYLKVLVIAVFALDGAQTASMMWLYYHTLIKCRSNSSPSCVTPVPAVMILQAFVAYFVPFIVQSFYTHRVWIISDKNRFITAAVGFFAVAQLALGIVCIVRIFGTAAGASSVLRANRFGALSAIAGAVCDLVITTSIMYYLRPARTGLKRKDNYLKKLNAVFVQMGILSLINASAVVIFYYVRSHGSGMLSIAPGVLLSKTYANSMLSVLNARKGIRDARQAQDDATIELPTILL